MLTRTGYQACRTRDKLAWLWDQLIRTTDEINRRRCKLFRKRDQLNRTRDQLNRTRDKLNRTGNQGLLLETDELKTVHSKMYLYTVRNAPEGEAVGSVHLTPDWPAAGVRLYVLSTLHISRILKRNEDMNSMKICKDLINKLNPGIVSVLFFVQWPCIMQMIYRHCDTDK